LVRYIAENEDDALTLRESAPKAYLVLVANGRISHSFPLRGEIQLGRDKSNGVVIADQKVSRHHALLSPLEDTFILNDQGSANGTYLNGVLISQPTRLKDRDKVTLGDTTFIYPSAVRCRYHQSTRSCVVETACPASLPKSLFGLVFIFE
jgi:predicted component of type VI protein secretion system